MITTISHHQFIVMTPRSLFNVVLKILGILFIKDILAVVPQLLSVFYMIKYNQEGEIGMTLAMTFLTLLIYIVVAYYLIFKSELIIDKLKLEQGFDQDNFPLNIHRSTILSICIIVIGGLLIAEEIPNFCRQLYSYFQEKRLTFGQTNPTLTYTILSFAKIIVGLLLVGNQKQIVSFIELKRNKNGG
jgi:hypothetical protein